MFCSGTAWLNISLRNKGWQNAATLRRAFLLFLESKSGTYLSRERVRQRHSAGRDKVDRLPEGAGSQVPTVVVAEICAVGQVEELNKGRQIQMLPEPEVLRHAGVELEERLTAQVIISRELTLPGSQAITIFSAIGCASCSGRAGVTK